MPRPSIKSMIRVTHPAPEPNRFAISFAWVFGGAIAVVVALILFHYWGVAETKRMEAEQREQLRNFFRTGR